MSAITIGGDLIHYEKLGRGRPVILIHGWVGSWRYWIPVMSKLHTKYSVYTLDLIGFGDSAKNVTHYDLQSQVKMLEQFLDQLGITKSAIIAHGFGTMVATQYALKNPTKVARMLLTSVPLFDPGDLDGRTPAGTAKLLTSNRDRYSMAPSLDKRATDVNPSTDLTLPSAGQSVKGTPAKGGLYTPFHEMPTINRPDTIDREKLREAAAARLQRRDNNQLMEIMKGKSTMDLLEKTFRKSEPEYEKLKTDVSKADNEVLAKSALNYSAGDMLDDLRRITAPVVVVHGQDDPIIPSPSEAIWNYLTVEKEDVMVPIPLSGVRHFPMLESDAYSRLVTDFLDTADISTLEIRDRWRRRSR